MGGSNEKLQAFGIRKEGLTRKQRARWRLRTVLRWARGRTSWDGRTFYLDVPVLTSLVVEEPETASDGGATEETT